MVILVSLQSTLDFAEENELCVIPIRHRGKRPSIAWKEYRRGRSTPEEIKGWFGQESNIAFVCGKVSGGDGRALVIIDFDDLDVYNAFYPTGPKTRAVRTSKGYHIYFFTPEPIPKFRIEIEKDGKTTGVDVQGEGSYAIAPPSVHPSGTIYKWVNDLPIKFLDGETPVHFKEVLYHRIDNLCKGKGWKRKGSSHDIDEIIKGVKAGNRNNSAYVMASYYKQLGRAQIEVEDLLEQWNLKNNPPLPPSELMTVVKSVFKVGAKTGFDFGLDMDENLKFFTKEGKLKDREISEDILLRHTFLTMRDNPKEIYHYNPLNGIYERDGRNIIQTECKQNFGRVISDHWIREIISFLQTKTFTDRGEFSVDKHLIHVENGIFDLNQKKLFPFTPEIISTISIPVVYDPNATCPAFDDFLKQVAQAQHINLIWEWFGYSLWKSYEIHNALIIWGKGSNGKGTLLNVKRKFLGKQNVSNMSLQELEYRNFSRDKLFGKLENIYTDLEEKALTQTTKFKMLTGRDTVFADVKYHPDGVNFESFAKLTFSCNEVPRIEEDNYAIWRRIILIEFKNRFVPGVNRDVFIEDRLTTPEEFSGIFNKAVEALHSLLRRGSFDYDLSEADVRRNYLKLSDTLKFFVEERVEEEYGEEITKDDFYRAYKNFCKERGLKSKSKTYVGKHLVDHIDVDGGRQSTGDRRKTIWKDIKLKDQVGGVDEKSEEIEKWGENDVMS